MITFELAYKQPCDCHDICKQSVGHVTTTKYVDSFLSNLIFALVISVFVHFSLLKKWSWVKFFKKYAVMHWAKGESVHII